MIQKTGSISLFLLGCALAFTFCKSAPKVPLPPYDGFLAARQKTIHPGILEIYGGYAASRSDKTIRSNFNLLLQPGQKAYIEILNPSKQLVYAVSLDSKEVILSYVPQEQYIREEANTKNLQAITGFPLNSDDLILLVAGYGLDFADWQVAESHQDGWKLRRDSFTANVKMGEQIVRIKVSAPNQPEVVIEYDHYRTIDTYSLPSTIRFRVPSRKIAVEWKVEKFLPRDQPASEDLFAVDLKPNAERLSLNAVYKGKPLLLE